MRVRLQREAVSGLDDPNAGGMGVPFEGPARFRQSLRDEAPNVASEPGGTGKQA